jgi:hypothetical protein
MSWVRDPFSNTSLLEIGKYKPKLENIITETRKMSQGMAHQSTKTVD